MVITSEEQTSWVIVIPDVHPSLNKWTKMHFIARNNLKQEWGQMVQVLAMEAKWPQFDFPVELFITYSHPRDTVDLDNYTPKFIIDGLKSYFGDDNITKLKKIGWKFQKGEKQSTVEIRKYQE